MFRSFLSELIKLRRRWVIVGVYGPLIVFSVASTIFQIVLADRAGTPEGVGLKSGEQLEAADGLAQIITDSAAFAGVIVVILFATAFGTEFGWGTLRNLLVRQPNRIPLFSGKVLGLIDFTYVAILLSVAGAVLAALVLAPGQQISTDNWFTAAGSSAAVRSTVNLMLSTVGWASLGVLAAVAMRSPGPSVGVVLALFPVEGLVTTLWDKAPRWLPGQLLSAVARGGNIETDYDRALGLVLGYSAASLSVALWLFVRRDITS